MTTGKLNLDKLNNAHLFKGRSGTYLDFVLHDKPDQYGNAGFVTQSVSKEARERGEKGPIIGNWRVIETGRRAAPVAVPVDGAAEKDDVPF